MPWGCLISIQYKWKIINTQILKYVSYSFSLSFYSSTVQTKSLLSFIDMTALQGILGFSNFLNKWFLVLYHCIWSVRSLERFLCFMIFDNYRNQKGYFWGFFQVLRNALNFSRMLLQIAKELNASLCSIWSVISRLGVTEVEILTFMILFCSNQVTYCTPPFFMMSDVTHSFSVSHYLLF